MCYLILFDKRYEYATCERSSFVSEGKKFVLLEDTQFTTPYAKMCGFPGPFKRWRVTVNGEARKEYFLAEEAIRGWRGYLSRYRQHGNETKKLYLYEWWEDNGFRYCSAIKEVEQ